MTLALLVLFTAVLLGSLGLVRWAYRQRYLRREVCAFCGATVAASGEPLDEYVCVEHLDDDVWPGDKHGGAS